MLFLKKYIPGLYQLLRYNFSWLKGDVAAGLSVAAVALPVGIAYADLAGVPPVYGIYSAIFPLFAYALFGSSKQLITGPDAATCIIVASSLGPLSGGDPARYQALVIMLGLCTGLMYLIAGIVRLGFIANFLSLPILNGFLNGVSLLIIVGQLQKLTGLNINTDSFTEQVYVFFSNINHADITTSSIGVGLLILLFILKKLFPLLPNPLFIVFIGIFIVDGFDLQPSELALLGTVPSGLPEAITFPDFSFDDYTLLFRDAIALMLISFTSGILTAKSFAQKNKYEIDANQELIGFGACNIASGLAHGYPVTGAASRTAVCSAMGGKSQMVGVIAGFSMLLVLFYLTAPMASLPIAALAAVIMVSALDLFDLEGVKLLYLTNKREFIMSVVTTAGVLIVGALPGVMIAVVLSLLLLLAINSAPPTAVLGWVEEMKSYHNIEDFPEAQTTPGLLMFRFEANILFFNVDYFTQSIKDAIEKSTHPVKWLVIDASSINVIDVTAITKFKALREEYEALGITIKTSGVKNNVRRFFTPLWVEQNKESFVERNFTKLGLARKAYLRIYSNSENTF